MDKPITTRLPEDFISNLKEISKKENIDLSTVIRKLLVGAINEWRIKFALDKYSKGEFSFGEAAEFARVSVWDLPELLKKHKIHMNYDLEELDKDLSTLGWKMK